MPLAATIWTNPNGEYGSAGPFLLADASGKLLVDESGKNLTDSGIVVIPLAATVWSEDEGV